MRKSPKVAEPDPTQAFANAYSEWLFARGKVEEDVEVPDEDEMARRIDRRTTAAIGLISTPAVLVDDVWAKFELVEYLFLCEETLGSATHPLGFLALASLRTDLLILQRERAI